MFICYIQFQVSNSRRKRIMVPMRYYCLWLIDNIPIYMFWAILISCFGLLFKEIHYSVRKYRNSIKKYKK